MRLTREELVLLPVRASSRQEYRERAQDAALVIDQSKQAFLAEELFLIMMELYEEHVAYNKCVSLAWESISRMIFQYLGEQQTAWGEVYSLELRMFQTLHLGKQIFRQARTRFYAHVQAEEVARAAFAQM